jgi:hypothetical protein
VRLRRIPRCARQGAELNERNEQETNMNSQLLESITHAMRSAIKLRDDIREAHRIACSANPILAILLLDLLTDSVDQRNKLAEIEAIFESEAQA